jgi:hypothetical protein
MRDLFGFGNQTPKATRQKKPRFHGASLGRLIYLLSPEPGPVGVSVDPLGEALGPRVFPDGFIVLFGPPADAPLAFPMPVVPPVAPAPTDEPLLVPLAAVPPAAEPPPAEPPLLCASANVLDSANAVAKAIVVSFMGWFLVDDWHDNSPSRSSVPTPLREMSCRSEASGDGNLLPQPGTGRRCDDDRGHDVGRGGFYDR